MRVRGSNALVSAFGNLPAPVPLQEDEDWAVAARRAAPSRQAEAYAYWMRTSLHAAEVANAATTHQVSLVEAARAYEREDALTAPGKAPTTPGFSKQV